MADTQIERMEAVESAINALVVTKGATTGESLVVYSDPEQMELGKMFADAGIRLGLWTRLVVLEAGEEVRKELDTRTKEVLTSSKTDLAVNVFRTKAGETSYRIRFMRVERRRADRILHCRARATLSSSHTPLSPSHPPLSPSQPPLRSFHPLSSSCQLLGTTGNFLGQALYRRRGLGFVGADSVLPRGPWSSSEEL